MPSGSFQALVAGLHEGPTIVRPEPRIEVLHVFLRPLGLRAVVGVAPSELALRAVELSEIWGEQANSLLDRLYRACTWEERFALLNGAFLGAVIPAPASGAVTWAWQRLVNTCGGTSIDSVAREVGWSRRHLTERFRAEFGLTPKASARIFRFEQASWMLKSTRPRLADLAQACSYHDQAHLSREWQALAGRSPRGVDCRRASFPTRLRVR